MGTSALSKLHMRMPSSSHRVAKTPPPCLLKSIPYDVFEGDTIEHPGAPARVSTRTTYNDERNSLEEVESQYVSCMMGQLLPMPSASTDDH